jgi:hypothetical protein
MCINARDSTFQGHLCDPCLTLASSILARPLDMVDCLFLNCIDIILRILQGPTYKAHHGTATAQRHSPPNPDYDADVKQKRPKPPLLDLYYNSSSRANTCGAPLSSDCSCHNSGRVAHKVTQHSKEAQKEQVHWSTPYRPDAQAALGRCPFYRAQ